MNNNNPFPFTRSVNIEDGFERINLKRCDTDGTSSSSHAITFTEEDSREELNFDNGPESLKEIIYRTLSDDLYSWQAKLFRYYINSILLFSICLLILNGVPTVMFDKELVPLWFALETFVQVNFMLEYVIRLITCPNLRRFLLNVENFLDLLSFLPLFSGIYIYVTAVDHYKPAKTDQLTKGMINLFKILNLLRMIKLFKWAFHFEGIKVFVKAVGKSLNGVLFILLFWLAGGLFYASASYYVETSTCFFSEKRRMLIVSGSDSPCAYQNIGGK